MFIRSRKRSFVFFQMSMAKPSRKRQRAVRKSAAAGFTLIEIIIALFVFTIVSTILVSVLHTAMNAQSSTERNAARFRDLAFAWLIISRDMEQAVNRPIFDGTGREERAFLGEANKVRFTHTGWENPNGEQLRSTWQRTRYYVQNNRLYRQAWFELDRTEKTPSHTRLLLNDVAAIDFQYMDTKRKFTASWPPPSSQEALPAAVRVQLTFTDGNKMSQFYVLPGKINATTK